MNLQSYFDPLLFAVLPYVSMVVFLLGTIVRYRIQSFSYSSLSSQFLENRRHFWGCVPFHYGILVVLAGHVVAFLMPRQLLWWNQVPARLYVLEVSALAFGLLCTAGLFLIVARRLQDPKVKVVTSPADWIVYVLLLVEVLSGVHVALLHPWGSSWFAAAVTPYLRSLVTLTPDTAAVAMMPSLVKLHIVNAYLLIGFVPFSRLVHVLVVPNPYLWRKPQVVRWYRAPAAGR
ncbi:MAG: respiratory nitrate reductase subunit gamma [Acidobacteria bacterium]|nr:respiratory nitrate reductase subunit gamma [Acidobacteriota bacterium]